MASSASSSSLSTVITATTSLPPIITKPSRGRVRVRFPPPAPAISTNASTFLRLALGLGNRSPTRLSAGLTEIEPDLVENKRDRWATGGISPEDFKYGEYDGHHTYFEGGEKPSFWESVKEEYEAAEPPSGFQGFISWLFLPAIVAGLAYQVPVEYLYIGAAVFTVIFCGIEMGKPDKPHNFEPQIYNMERGSRDKLIADYNTMDIWDFNEKYGDLWDFTVKRDKL